MHFRRRENCNLGATERPKTLPESIRRRILKSRLLSRAACRAFARLPNGGRYASSDSDPMKNISMARVTVVLSVYLLSGHAAFSEPPPSPASSVTEEINSLAPEVSKKINDAATKILSESAVANSRLMIPSNAGYPALQERTKLRSAK